MYIFTAYAPSNASNAIAIDENIEEAGGSGEGVVLVASVLVQCTLRWVLCKLSGILHTHVE